MQWIHMFRHRWWRKLPESALIQKETLKCRLKEAMYMEKRNQSIRRIKESLLAIAGGFPDEHSWCERYQTDHRDPWRARRRRRRLRGGRWKTERQRNEEDRRGARRRWRWESHYWSRDDEMWSSWLSTTTTMDSNRSNDWNSKTYYQNVCIYIYTVVMWCVNCRS